jgi:hypothetical protein
MESSWHCRRGGPDGIWVGPLDNVGRRAAADGRTGQAENCGGREGEDAQKQAGLGY